MKLASALYSIILLLIFKASIAGAASSPRYDLAYIWDSDVTRVLNYREKVADMLNLNRDDQLKLVGRGKEYGVIGALNGTLAQTEATAVQHNAKLGRAGLQQAHPAKTNSYYRLYNVSYTRGPNLEVLKNVYSQIYATLREPAKDNLYIEKVDSQNFMIVYRCWQSKDSALKIAREHGTLLGKKKFSPAVVSAVDRPVFYSKSDRSGPPPFPSSWPSPRTVASSPTAQDIEKIRRAVRKIGLREEPIDNKKTAREQSLSISHNTAGLTKKMDVFLQEQKAKGTLQQQERTAWVAYDLTNDTYLVSINSQRLFQAASMIKPFVALAFFQQVDKGNLSYTPKSRQMMEDMIQKSSNQATNWFIRQLGGPARCETLLKKEYGHLFKQVKIKEYIPPGGRTYLNSALPSDYIQFLRALWNYQLPYSKEMLRLMALPGRDRIFYGTEVPNGTQVYNKTGTTAHLCGDMGILVPQTKDGRKVPYAIVGIVERSSTPADYKQWMFASGGAIRNFSTLIYEEMKRKHDLL